MALKIFLQLAAAVFSYSQQKRAQKKAARQARIARSNVLVNKSSSSEPIYTLYGKQRTGGTRVYIESANDSGNKSGTKNLYMVVALCEGEIGTIEQLWFNDTVVWDVNAEAQTPASLESLASGGYRLINGSSKYQGYYECRWYPGSATQTTDDLINVVVDQQQEWSGADRSLKGVSYLVIKFVANGDVWAGNLPTVTATLVGKKIRNVNNTSNFISGPNQNPADVLYDYLTNRVYGKGLDHDQDGNYVPGLHIDLASFQFAKSRCVSARGGLGYAINGYMQTEKQLFDNIGEILELCNGILLFKDGKYNVKIRRANESPVLTMSEKNILSEITVSLPDKSKKLNKMTGVYNNPDVKYNDDIIIIDDDTMGTTYLQEDNGSILEDKEEYTLTTDTDLVQDLLVQRIKQSRNLTTISFTASHEALLLGAGDVIEVVYPIFGWGPGVGEERKYFRVQELSITPENTIDVVATTYQSDSEL